METKTFGEQLLTLIRAAGYPSQRRFAQSIDMDPTYLSRIIKGGVARPERETLEKMANKLRMPFDELASMAGLRPALSIEEERDSGREMASAILGVDEVHRTQLFAELGEQVLLMMAQRQNIIPGPEIRLAPGVLWRIPVVNNLSASQLASDIRQVETWIELPHSMLKGAKDPVAFIVVGDCLQERWGIRTGDTLIVDAANKDPRDGEIVAALIDDQDRTAKEFYRVPDGIDLRPTTKGYSTIEIRGETQLVIIGVYVTFLPTGER